MSRQRDQPHTHARTASSLTEAEPSSGRPLLFLDVDGPLIPFGRPTGNYPAYPPEDANPLLSRLDPGHGPKLAALPCELVWATTWLHEANESITPRLGLPPLPVVDWPDTDEPRGLHWKTRTLVTWAAGRPFAWVDDELTAADQAWVAAHHPGPALLHRVDPREGLTAADYTALETWSRRIVVATGVGRGTVRGQAGRAGSAGPGAGEGAAGDQCGGDRR